MSSDVPKVTTAAGGTSAARCCGVSTPCSICATMWRTSPRAACATHLIAADILRAAAGSCWFPWAPSHCSPHSCGCGAGDERTHLAQIHARARNLRASRVGVRGRVEVLALGSQLLDESLELGHAPFRRADGHAVLAARVAAGLARVQPVLNGAGQQAVGD